MFLKNKLTLICGLIAGLCSISSYAQLEEIVVTGELIDSNILELPNSVTVIDSDAISERTAQNLEDLFALAPNINFTTGASRGRFIQIRGIGERSEFSTPINNSVGVILDGIDLTGLSTAVSSLDTQQVEVLRGPQGTLFGANALAGLINVVSNKPTDEIYSKVTFGLEEFDGREFSAVFSEPINEDIGYRVAVKHYESDGFTKAVFLDRDDTANIDETTAKFNLVAQANEKLELDFNVFFADINNGYDAFSLSNTRETDTDEPGVDEQQTIAGAIKASYQISDSLTLESTLSHANSDLEYSFDEDWSNPFLCDNASCPFGDFSSFDQYTRDNVNTTLDVRLVSNPEDSINWVLGGYFRDQEIDLERVYTFLDDDFESEFDTTNAALYGQITAPIVNGLSLTVGSRIEHRGTDYRDNTGVSASPDETLWGGRIALEYLAQDGTFVYGLISRGYKAGGVNLEGSLTQEQRSYDTETLINYEVGFKKAFFNDTLHLKASAFYQDRDDIQIDQSIVASVETGEIDGVCPCTFTDFIANAADGSNRGIEVELDWYINDHITLFSAIGYLDTEFGEFESFTHIEADDNTGIGFDLEGREQAQAPSYTAVIGGEVTITKNIAFSGSVEAKDDFLFSNDHEGRADSYELLNLELSYSTDNWSIAIYGKNVTDELIQTRGFGTFGNDPRDGFTLNEYFQFGAPRLLGVKASVEF